MQEAHRKQASLFRFLMRSRRTINKSRTILAARNLHPHHPPYGCGCFPVFETTHQADPILRPVGRPVCRRAESHLGGDAKAKCAAISDTDN